MIDGRLFTHIGQLECLTAIFTPNVNTLTILIMCVKK